MNITVKKEPIKTVSDMVVRKERLMWVELPKRSFPVSVYFWEYPNGAKRTLMAIEVRGNYFSKWESVASLWKEVSTSLAYEINTLSGEVVSETYQKQVMDSIKKQVKDDKIKISKSRGCEDND